MTDIWTDARSSGFTKEKLIKHVQTNGEGIINQVGGRVNLTPLIYAIESTRFANVKLLLDNKADAEKPDPAGLTPIIHAASLKRGGRAIVSELLSRKIGNYDEPDPTMKETPLMKAVSKGNDPEVVKLLVRAGASREKRNADGKTADDLAAEITDPDVKKKVQDALKEVPDRDRGGVLTYFSDWAIYVLGYFKQFGPVGKILAAATDYFYKVTGSETPALPEVDLDATEMNTVEDVKNNLQGALDEKGLDRFYNKPGDTYLDDVAKKILDLKNDPNTTLKEPPQLKDLGTLALYQPVIFCDDSASMRNDWPSNNENRWVRQRGLVKRITEITNLAVPNKRGVYLRFMNKSMPDTRMMGDEVEKNLITEPGRGNYTPIGSSLKKNVLKPFVYDVINSGKQLERPLLVLMTTDGCPWCEEDAKDGNMDKTSVEYGIFRQNIVECMNFLKEKGYRSDVVIFCLNQIGSHPDATDFMNSLKNETKLAEVLYLTAERLDDKFDEYQDNARTLETWLLEVLLKPLKTIWAP